MYKYSNRDVPFIRDHAAALKLHERIKPLKGGPLKGKRPVGARRKTYQRIHLTEDSHVKIIEGWREGYVNSEITFYASGVITVAWPNGYMNASSLGFISAILGIDINFRGKRPWIHGVVAQRQKPGTRKWDRQYEDIKGSFPLYKGILIRLERKKADTGTRDLMLHDPVFPVVRGIDKEKAKATRERYRPFALYMKGLLGVRDHGFTDTEYTEYEINTLSREDMMKLVASSEPTDNLKAVMWLAKANRAPNRYRFGGNDGADTLWMETKNKVWVDYDRMLLDHHDAYTWSTRTDGRVYRGPLRLNIGQRD